MKNYKSLGQMLKAGDFSSLKNDLLEMIGNGTISELKLKKEAKHVNELDELLFYIPDFAHNEDGSIRDGCKDVLNICLEQGSNENCYMKNGENFYLKSFQIKDEEINRSSLSKSTDKEYSDGMGNNALIYAIMGNNVRAIEILINEYKFDPNKKNILSNNQTPLHFACGLEKKDSILKLTELGGDLSIKDGSGYTPAEMIELAFDEELQEEYSDEPEMIEKSKTLYKEVLLLSENKPKEKINRLKKFYR